MRDCVDTLDAGPKQAIALAFYQGLSHSELAAHLRAAARHGEVVGAPRARAPQGLPRPRGGRRDEPVAPRPASPASTRSPRRTCWARCPAARARASRTSRAPTPSVALDDPRLGGAPAPLAEAAPPITPSPQVWRRIALRLGLDADAAVRSAARGGRASASGAASRWRASSRRSCSRIASCSRRPVPAAQPIVVVLAGQDAAAGAGGHDAARQPHDDREGRRRRARCRRTARSSCGCCPQGARAALARRDAVDRRRPRHAARAARRRARQRARARGQPRAGGRIADGRAAGSRALHGHASRSSTSRSRLPEQKKAGAWGGGRPGEKTARSYADWYDAGRYGRPRRARSWCAWRPPGSCRAGSPLRSGARSVRGDAAPARPARTARQRGGTDDREAERGHRRQPRQRRRTAGFRVRFGGIRYGVRRHGVMAFLFGVLAPIVRSLTTLGCGEPEIRIHRHGTAAWNPRQRDGDASMTKRRKRRKRGAKAASAATNRGGRATKASARFSRR